MKKIVVTILFLFLCLHNISAQVIKDYKWDEVPKFEQIPEKYMNEPAVVLLDRRWVHNRVEAYGYASFTMNHFAVKINAPEQINNFNKVKAENRGYVRQVRDFHARVIKPSGEIKLIPEDRIVEKEIDKVKQYVFEGVEAGDILEYYFIIKEYPIGQSVEVFQRESPVLKAEMIFTSTGMFRFYPVCSPEFIKESSNSRQLYRASDIPAHYPEKYTNTFASLAKVIFMTTSSSSMDDWKSVLQNIAYKGFLYLKRGQARELIKQLNITDSMALDQKLERVDKYIKQNFKFVAEGERAQKVSSLLEENVKLTPYDMYGLYNYIFRNLNLNYQLIAAVEQYYGTIDQKYFFNPLPHKFLYYFPETNKYIMPGEKYATYGYPLYPLQNTKAKVYDSQTKKISEILISETPVTFTNINTTSTITLSPDLGKATVQKTYNSTGYQAQLNRYQYTYIKEYEDEKKQTEYLKYVLMDETDIKLSDVNVTNSEIVHNYNNTPFTVAATINLNQSITEEAGNLIMVNVGKVLGKQTNLYQEKERKSDVYLSYNKTYQHTIHFTIPQGYTLENYTDLIINKTMDIEKPSFFKSNATLNNNILTVTITEQYPSIYYTKEQYNQYKNVINAAFDFSKATIVLKKI